MLEDGNLTRPGGDCDSFNRPGGGISLERGTRMAMHHGPSRVVRQSQGICSPIPRHRFSGLSVRALSHEMRSSGGQRVHSNMISLTDDKKATLTHRFSLIPCACAIGTDLLLTAAVRTDAHAKFDVDLIDICEAYLPSHHDFVPCLGIRACYGRSRHVIIQCLLP
ncbi:hypothetical protein OF83DRAFT_538456 [Amylostereum chailletii]|nr:hypothetical protein OF83DRAFT_538456 [Amylostereum chailletii]